jgi:uncharacterized protein YjlB
LASFSTGLKKSCGLLSVPKMSEPKTYKLEATELIPNSPYLLVHYPGFFPSEDQAVDAAAVYDVFARNGWETQWIFRYGPTQRSHYHSQTHECMAVLSGTATIRFGVSDMDEGSTYATRRGQGGLELHAKSGDVFVIPAGVSHKTYETSPPADLELLTPGEGRGIAGIDIRQVLERVQLSGFTMMGAYPQGGIWDFATGGEHAGNYEAVWSVPKPDRDPVMGEGGICGLWV